MALTGVAAAGCISDRRQEFETTFAANEYFVVGDNLNHSFEDSRPMGPINPSLIKGFVAFVIRRPPKKEAPRPRSREPASFRFEGSGVMGAEKITRGIRAGTLKHDLLLQFDELRRLLHVFVPAP